MAGSLLGSGPGSPMTTATPTERLVASRPGTRATPAASLWDEGFRRFRRHRLAALGAVVLFAMVVAVVAGPAIYRVPINDIDFKAKLRGPSWPSPLGTDDLGQDLLARMLYGGRISLAVGVTAMLIAITVGVMIGATAGQLGGAVDHALMRITDLFLSLPQLPLLLLMVYLFRDVLRQALGPEVGVFVLIVVVIGGLRWMPVARLVPPPIPSLRGKGIFQGARGPRPPPPPPGRPPHAKCSRAEPCSRAPALPAQSILGEASEGAVEAPSDRNYIGDGLRDALDPRKVISR